MFILADPELIKFANRIDQDLPGDATIVSFAKDSEKIGNESTLPSPAAHIDDGRDSVAETSHLDFSGYSFDIEDSPPHVNLFPLVTGPAPSRPQLSIFGAFLEELISLQASTH